MKNFILSLIGLIIISLISCDPSKPVGPEDVTNFIIPTDVKDWQPQVKTSNGGNRIEISIGNMCREYGIPAPSELDSLPKDMKFSETIELSVESEIIQLYESQVILLSLNQKSEYLELIRDPFNKYKIAEKNFYKALSTVKYIDYNINQLLAGLTATKKTEKEILVDLFNFPIWLINNQINKDKFIKDMLYSVDTSITKYLKDLVSPGYETKFNEAIENYKQNVSLYYSFIFTTAESIKNFCNYSYNTLKDFDTPDTPDKIFDINEAERKGLISYNASSDYTFNGRGMRFTIDKKTNEDISIVIPAGLVFQTNKKGIIKNSSKILSLPNLYFKNQNVDIKNYKNDEILSESYQPLINSNSVYFRFMYPGDGWARKMTGNWKNLIVKYDLNGAWYLGNDGNYYYRCINLKHIEPELYQQLMEKLDREVDIKTDCSDNYATISLNGTNYGIKYRNCIVYADGSASNWIYRQTDITIIP